MAEEKFELPPLTPEESRALEERMNTKVDSRAMARAMIAARTPRPDSWAEAFARKHGFDPRWSLTDLENFDAGDGFAVHDEAEVHALRRVPLSYWTGYDAFLMLAYQEGGERTLWLALDILSSIDPADEHAMSLLDAAARHLAREQPAPTPAGVEATAVMTSVIARFDQAIWQCFEAQAEEDGLGPEERASERERLRRGMPAAGYERFGQEAADLGDLARVRNRLAARTVLRHARAEMIYAVYRPQRGLEIVPPRDFADPAIRAHLEHPDTFYFRRMTYFDLVPAREDGVRLRHYAESSQDNSLGIAFATEDEALAYAEAEFGVPRSAWRDGPLAPDHPAAQRLWA